MLKLILKSKKEQEILLYEESYNDSRVSRTITLRGSENLGSIIESLTEDELSEAHITGVFGDVALPKLRVASGYRVISDESAPNASIHLEEVDSE